MSTKHHILALLEGNRGQSISGQQIAEQLGISRNAVWKTVKELEKDGHKIKSVTGKGYLLCEDSDVLSVQGMLPFLPCVEMAENIHLYDHLASTNKTAKEMAVSGAGHGTAIIADMQTAGSGRYNRKFFSPPGGIYLSLVLHPVHLWFDPSMVTLFAALSVCEAIEAVCQKQPQIKWVNDILLEEKKIGGILTQAIVDFESGATGWIILGIGINFSTPELAFPEELRKTAGSIFAREKPTVSRNRLIAEVIGRVLAPAAKYSEKEIIERYKQRLSTLGQKVLVSSGGSEPYPATALDIDSAGHLVVQTSSGEILCLSAGEVSILKASTQ